MSDSPTVATPPAPTAQPAAQTTFTVYTGPPLETIRLLVASQFQVKDAYLDPYGVPTILVAAEPPRRKFQSLLAELGKNGLVAALRGSGDTLTIKVFQKPRLNAPRLRINLVLFLATIGTVLFGGYYYWNNLASLPWMTPFVSGANPFLKAGLFAVGLLSIVGLHELGHKGAAQFHKMDATLPYFVPGPPPIGTFGALISLRAPPANRDQLFDLGLSGPVVGFVVTVIVALASVFAGILLTPAQVQLAIQNGAPTGGWPDEPMILLLTTALGQSFRPETVLFETQLSFAAYIGSLLTFLNIIPAWQLDGGHISRAVFGANGHRIATLIGLILLLVTGFWTFAILVLIMMSFSRRGFAGVEPLDDVSPVSNSRKAMYVLALVMLFLTFSVAPPL